MNISSESIKKKAIELGFQKVGITEATETISEQNNLRSWLKKNNHADMKWMENRSEERGNIHKYFPEARSVISVGMNYYTCLLYTSPSPRDRQKSRMPSSA